MIKPELGPGYYIQTLASFDMDTNYSFIQTH